MDQNDPGRIEVGAGDRAPGRAGTPDAGSRRIAELEAENAALRRALADARAGAGRAVARHGVVLAQERTGRSADQAGARQASAEAEARHGREVAASRGDLAASEAGNAALRRANAALAESRAVLREREERLRLVLDSAADCAIFTTDLDRRVTSWNAGAQRLMGWTESEIVGRTADLIFTPEDRAAAAPQQEATGALREGRASNERWHARKDGSRFWASGLVMPLRDTAAGPGAPPLGLLKIMRDRTEQRRAEDALRARERRLRVLADTAARLLAAADPDEVLGPVFGSLSEEFGLDVSFSYAADGDGDVLRLASCFGVPEERRPGFAWLKPGQGFCGEAALTRRPVLVADALASSDPRCETLRALAIRAYVVFPHLAGDGRLLGTLSFGSRGLFSEDDLAFLAAIAHCVAVVRERLRAEAALREGERRLQATQDHAGVGIHEVDAEGRYARANETFLRMTGYAAEDFEGRAFWDFIEDEADRRDARDAFARLVRGEADRLVAERAYTGKHGRRWWAEATATAIRDERGRFLYAVRVVHDITERKRAEERLRAAEARQGFLLRLGDALRPLHDAADIQAEACRLLGGHLGVAQVGFGEIDAAQERVTVHRDWNDGRVPSVVGTWRMDDFGPAFVAAMKRGETAAIPDVALDPRTDAPAVLAAYAGIGARAILDVPLVKGGRMAAMLFVHHPEPRSWSAAEVEAAEEACARLWEAVERARAEAALRESEGRRRAALDAARLGTWEWDPATGAVALDERAREIFGFAPGEGGRDGEVFGRVRPDDLPRVRAASMAAAAALSRLELEYRVALPGGGERAVSSLGDGLPGAGAGAGRMAGVFADVTERRRAEERRALLVNELNHRVKNTLAVVQSLALQTARGAPDLPSFSAAFQARLIALARAHDLLTREDWEGAALADVARAALWPLAGGGDRVDLGACPPGALLPPAQALALALALHELGTNALKHGALSAPGGRVSVRCGADPAGGGARVVEWLERGGPPVPGPPARRGFGLRLLERGLTAQAGMAAELRFEPAGVRCVLRLPPAPEARFPARA